MRFTRPFMRYRVVVLLLVPLCLHGTVGHGAGQVAQPGDSKPTRILFLGNSITLHGPLPEIGWTNNWGMAASAMEKDYVHLLTGSIAKLTGNQPEVRVANIADFERQYSTYDPKARLKEQLDFKPALVVVAIGENVSALTTEVSRAKFKDSFARLLATFKENGQPDIFVRSCFWADQVKDRIMQDCCKAVHGVFVDISSLGKDEANHARAERKFSHAGVADHPGDKGMKAIADALLKAMRSRLPPVLGRAAGTAASRRISARPPATPSPPPPRG